MEHGIFFEKRVFKYPHSKCCFGEMPKHITKAVFKFKDGTMIVMVRKGASVGPTTFLPENKMHNYRRFF